MDGPTSQLLTTSSLFRQDSEVLVMTIEVADGRQDVIYVREGDDPAILAQDFASRYGLDSNTTLHLARLIAQNKAAAKKMMRKSASAHPGLQNGAKPQGERNGSVFDRLYQRKKKPQEPRPVSATARKPGEASRNYGEWLYFRGMQAKETQQRQAQAKIQADQKAQARQMPFKPTIDRNSALLAPRLQARTEDLLLKKEAQKQEKIALLKAEIETDRLKECSFTPKIDPRSQHLTLCHSSQQPRYMDLFHEAVKRKERQVERSTESTKTECPFKPTTNGPKADIDQASFLDRIVNSKRKFEEEMAKVRQEIVTDTDEATGQKLFRPVLQQDYQRTLEAGSVHEHLYLLRDQKQQTVHKMAEELNEHFKAAQNRSKVSENSAKLLEMSQKRTAERLFALLDSDSDGYISVSACNIEALDPKSAQILVPVLSQLTSDMVSFLVFEEWIEELLRTLNGEERAHLMRKAGKEEASPMKGTAIQKSLSLKSDLFARKRRQSLPEDLYARQTSEKLVNGM